MPGNRVNHCMTSVRELLIIYGGTENNTGAIYNELWIYNTISGVWKRHQSPIEIKDTCLSSSMCAVGNVVYIFGGNGLDDDDYRQTNSVVSFNIANDTWDTVYPHTDDYDANTPPPMSGNYLFYHNGSLYVLWGYHESLNLDTIYRFSLKSSTWSMLPQNGVKPTLNRQIFGTIYRNKIYCFESPYAGTKRFTDILIFDLSTHTWISRAIYSKNHHYPDHRYFESWAFSGHIGFMSGGIRPYSTNMIYSDIWRIDLECLEWFQLEYSLKTGVYGHCTSLVDDFYLYTFGGYHGDGFVNTWERFTVQPKTLYYSCLECIRHSQNLRNHKQSLPVAIANQLNYDSFFDH
ncbi:Kelch domain-containing protein 1 [Thelohanellus kitauei]|uniref:Kelch domain-containing protein 1 n=1 Tax=Thelohanellus kitauei TaxID=669202 RepID=A0A0C2NES7_THEKT|nr:Kelch domain-containing protein 1 [Thelohanellus kitauei]